ncbi:hypothetical protein M422DRAFT_43550 [Sphaerobolus stellatus SS14]|nr:hypothetical protein M422DRAFT_43550 [Sphaerobolus stellatus SS14]
MSWGVNNAETVGHILHELRRRHLIPSPKRAQPKLYYDSFQRQALDINWTMQFAKIGALSVLSLRYSVPGGTGLSTRIPNDSSIFPKPKRFPAKHLERWIPSSTQQGQWECIVCDNGKAIESKRVKRHEEQADHTKTLKGWLRDLNSSATSSNVHPVVRGQVQATVASLLCDASDLGPHSSGPSHVHASHPTQTQPHMDWDAPGMDFDGNMGQNHHEDAMQKLIGSLAQYMLDDGAIEADSEDELVERDDEAESDSESDEAESVTARFTAFLNSAPDLLEEGTKRGQSSTKVGENKPWFPWPDKEV